MKLKGYLTSRSECINVTLVRNLWMEFSVCTVREVTFEGVKRGVRNLPRRRVLAGAWIRLTVNLTIKFTEEERD